MKRIAYILVVAACVLTTYGITLHITTSRVISRVGNATQDFWRDESVMLLDWAKQTGEPETKVRMPDHFVKMMKRTGMAGGLYQRKDDMILSLAGSLMLLVTSLYFWKRGTRTTRCCVPSPAAGSVRKP